MLLLAGPAAAQICGDVNCGGDINATDALAVLRVAVGIATDVSCPSECGLRTRGTADLCADVDCSQTVNTTDALAVLRAGVGLPSSLRCEDECVGGSSTTTTSSSTSSSTLLTSTTLIPREPPAKIVAIGDSITQAFAADCSCNTEFGCADCILDGDQPNNSWFSGSGTSFLSVHDRYLELDAAVVADKSAATDGAELVQPGDDNFLVQVQAYLEQEIIADHVEILLGGNDICDRNCVAVANCGDPLYTDEEWRAGLRAGLDLLVAGLPLGSSIYLLSVPRIHDLRAIGLIKEETDANVDCDDFWDTFDVCRIATDGGTLNNEDLATRLAAIGERQRRYNEILLEEAQAYDMNTTGQNPRGIEVFAEYAGEETPSIGTYRFEPHYINGGDCYHPSLQGQNTIAGLAWDRNLDR